MGKTVRTPKDVLRELSYWSQKMDEHHRILRKKRLKLIATVLTAGIGTGFLTRSLGDNIFFAVIVSGFCGVFLGIRYILFKSSLATSQIVFARRVLKLLIADIPSDAPVDFSADIVGISGKSDSSGVAGSPEQRRFFLLMAPLDEKRRFGISVDYTLRKKGRRKNKGYKQKAGIRIWAQSTDLKVVDEALLRPRFLKELKMTASWMKAEDVEKRFSEMQLTTSPGEVSFKMKAASIIKGTNFEPEVIMSPDLLLSISRAVTFVAWN